MADSTVRADLLAALADKAKKKAAPQTFRTSILEAPPGDPQNPKQSFDEGDDYSNLQSLNNAESYAQQRKWWPRAQDYVSPTSVAKNNTMQGDIYKGKRR